MPYKSFDGIVMFIQLDSGNNLFISLPLTEFENINSVSMIDCLKLMTTYKDNASDVPASFAFIEFLDTEENINIVITDNGYSYLTPTKLSEPLNLTFDDGSVHSISVKRLPFSFAIDGEDKTLCTVKKDGLTYLGVCKENGGTGTLTYCCSDMISDLSSSLYTLFFVLFCFIIILNTVILYIFYMRKYCTSLNSDESYNSSAIQSKIRIAPVVGIILIGLAAYFSLTVFNISNSVIVESDYLNEIHSVYGDRSSTAADPERKVKEVYLEYANAIADHILASPERIDQHELANLESILGLNGIILYDTSGNMTVSSGEYLERSFGTKESSPTYAYNNLKNGYPYVFQDITTNEQTGESTQAIAVSIRSSDNVTTGFLEIIFPVSRILAVTHNASLENVLSDIALPGVSSYLSIGKENKEIRYTSNKYYIGLQASDIGFTEESMQSGYFGKLNIMGNPYYAQNTVIEDNLVYVITSEREIQKNRIPFTILAILLYLIDYAVLYYIICSRRNGYDRIEYILPEDESSADEDKRMISPYRSFICSLRKEVSPEKKIFRILLFIAEFAVVLFAVFAFLMNRLNLSSRFLSRVISGSWPRGINAFSATACMLLIVTGILVTVFLNRFINLIAHLSNARGQTICRLLQNFVKYISVIIILFFCLSFFGADTKTIAASAGILGLVIGMGARDMVTDILAGLTIIFEGEFQVGDIVEIGGFSGMVQEIGIRTTKIASWNQNVKIINNRNVSNVVNMAQRSSFAIIDFSLPISATDQPLEKIFYEEFKDYKKKYPILVDVPHYKGITKFSGNKIECRVSAEVPELSRGEMERNLLKDVIDILRTHDVPMG